MYKFLEVTTLADLENGVNDLAKQGYTAVGGPLWFDKSQTLVQLMREPEQPDLRRSSQELLELKEPKRKK